MRRVMILEKDDFFADTFNVNKGLLSLKPHIAELESHFDIVGYIQGSSLKLFKNRIDSLNSVAFCPDIFFPQENSRSPL